MQKRELNTCKQDIYSFLHFLLPTNPRPSKAGVFSVSSVRDLVLELRGEEFAVQTGDMRDRDGFRAFGLAGSRVGAVSAKFED